MNIERFRKQHLTARTPTDLRKRQTQRPGGQGVAGSNPAVPTVTAGQRPHHQPGEWPQDLL